MEEQVCHNEIKKNKMKIVASLFAVQTERQRRMSAQVSAGSG